MHIFWHNYPWKSAKLWCQTSWCNFLNPLFALAPMAWLGINVIGSMNEETSRKWLTVAIFQKWQDSSVALWIDIAVMVWYGLTFMVDSHG